MITSLFGNWHSGRFFQQLRQEVGLKFVKKYAYQQVDVFWEKKVLIQNLAMLISNKSGDISAKQILQLESAIVCTQILAVLPVANIKLTFSIYLR